MHNVIDSLLLGLHYRIRKREMDWLREAVNNRFTALTICAVLAPKSIDTHEHQEPKIKREGKQPERSNAICEH